MEQTNTRVKLSPPYIGDRKVNADNVAQYIRVDGDRCTIFPPEWISDLIMVQANIVNTTAGGSFASGLPLLDHLAQMGVNALWLTPFFENEGNANRVSHYGNHGPHTLAADSFRAKTFAARAAELREFVRQAHLRDIYVFADVVTYGVLAASPIYRAYRNGTAFEGMDVSEWFTGEPLYSGYRFRWESASLRSWFTDRMTALITDYGFDGFRVDSEPTYLWYDGDGDGIKDRYADVFSEVRLRVAGFARRPDGSLYYPEGAQGRSIAVFSEKNNLRTNGYDFEQHGVIHYGSETSLSFEVHQADRLHWFAITDLARSVRSGKIADGRWFTEYLHTGADFVNRFRYYTYCISNHDSHAAVVNRRLWVMGYQAILAPFLPVWYCGEECGLENPENRWLNAVPANPDVLLQNPDNAAFCEQVRRLIAIRRSYGDLFAMPEEDIRKSNVAETEVSRGALGYARYSAARLALVLANPGQAPLCCDVFFDEDLLPENAMPDFVDLLELPGRETQYRAQKCGNRYCIRNIRMEAGGMAVLFAETGA